ncbi:MAG: ABC transporter permease [Prevotellaceae bacterium]|nr:ABC transporter permease [Prevotellaceae bacterium]
MKFRLLPAKNIRHFRRFYVLIAVATAIATGVVVGSLAVGDSVRSTLVARVSERLGSTQTVIFSRSSFLDTAILHTPLLKGCEARGVLLSNGFVSSSGRLIPVMVWGVADMNIAGGSAKINEPLRRELGSNEASNSEGDIVLRLPATGLVPSGSLFVTSTYSTSLRLTLAGIAGVQEGGNLSLKNEQTLPLNVFVNRSELAEAMAIEGKINLITSPQRVAQSAFNSAWNPAFSGLAARRKRNELEVRSDRVFIQPEAVDNICRRAPHSNRLLSYLVNTLSNANGQAAHSIPYSFVTALESYNGVALRDDEIILSDYAARRMNAGVGDRVMLTFYTSHDLKILRTDTATLRVQRVVPLSALAADTGLSAEFPGLSDVENCTDWDSDLPIDMGRISKEDERYWELYRSTPKALVSYAAVARQWSNAYGSATAIRMASSFDFEQCIVSFGLEQCALTPAMLGVQLIYPRELGLQAAWGGVDFASLFLSLGIFIIIAAMLLLRTPLAEMLQLRSGELALLQSLGWCGRRIRRMLWREAAPVVALAAVAGVVLGLLYTLAVTWLLGNIWRGATHTDGFTLVPSASAIAGGLLAGLGLSLLVLWRAIARGFADLHRPAKGRTATPSGRPASAPLAGLVLSSLLTLGVALANIFVLHSAALFVLVGALLLITAALWGRHLVARRRGQKFSFANLMFASLYAGRRQQALSFFTLASGVFIVFAVGLNRQGNGSSEQLRAGTGGYALWCESAVPIYHNIATQQGREKLALQLLPNGAEALQLLRFSADNASCLNLNKVTNPTVLGVDMQALMRSDFRLSQCLYGDGNSDSAAQHLRRLDGRCIPALVDETVLLWSLMRQLGDTLHYSGSNGQHVMLRLAGTLQNTVFQGNILVDKKLFAEAWSDIGGSEVALLKLEHDELPAAKQLLETALSEYGVRVTPTAERLSEFNSVTDAYLSIFMTLGGLGMLLGLFGLVVVVRKNLAARDSEIATYRSLGFTDKKLSQLLLRENLATPLYAVLAGFACAVVGVSAVAANVSFGLWVFALVLLVLMVGGVVGFVRREIRLIISNGYAVFCVEVHQK